jgi:hypothetical protein
MSAAAAAVVSGERMFTAGFMAGIANVALPVARLVAVEVVEALFASSRQRSVVAVVGVKAVVDMAVKAAVAVKPRTRSDEEAALNPVGPIVAVGGAVIRLIVEVAVGAIGRHSNVDGNLG